jgi:hypothetical protein
MKLLKVMPFVVSAVLLIPLNSYADDEPPRRQARHLGYRWTAGGSDRKLEGPLAVGTCAEVEYEGNLVEEIESEKMSKCGK